MLYLTLGPFGISFGSPDEIGLVPIPGKSEILSDDSGISFLSSLGLFSEALSSLILTSGVTIFTSSALTTVLSFFFDFLVV